MRLVWGLWLFCATPIALFSFCFFFFYNIIVIIIIIIIIIIIVKMNSLLKSYKNLIKTTHKTSVKYSVT